VNNALVKLDETLLALKNLHITSIFPNHNFIHITFSNGTKISTSAYSYTNNKNIKYDTSSIRKLVEEEFAIYETELLELTPKMEKELSENFNRREKEEKKCQKIGERLQELLESYQPSLTIKEVAYKKLDTLVMTFNEIENFYIKLYASSLPAYQLKLEAEDYDFIITNTECRISCENVEKDYKSFSSAAKSRFRRMAKELGYEQITGIVYIKERDGWYENFNLQSSQYGNPFFYFNYGVVLSDKFPLSREELRDAGWNLGGRLCPVGSNSFPAGNKKQIEESAILALELYKEKVVPWFESLTLEKIKKEINR
jgi:hypothetical protein